MDGMKSTSVIRLFRDDGKRYQIERPDKGFMYTEMKTETQKRCFVFICISEFHREDEFHGFVYPKKESTYIPSSPPWDPGYPPY